MNRTQIQFLGHATFKITTPEGKSIIVDPWLINNKFIPEEYKNQPKIDLMLVTHGHDDHFDNKIVDLIDQYQPKVIANSICRWYLLEEGVNSKLIEPLNLGGTISLLDVKVSMVNAFHLSHINITNTKIDYPHAANGYILQLSDDVRIYFAGDTSIFGDMKLIAEIYKPTIAVLPIGDRFTMGPLEASHAIRMLDVKHVIPFHYGTYPFLTGTPEELVKLTSDIEGLTIHALKAGEMLDCGNL
ncbi:metal-dependent hydrolase [Solitalea koreensis]|uniref:L-ascorbate metabolism protein UlaG, beta-lactamase superfamily n=1 Tax=Solitalea koreensis TaxID=543615 RepID=A0A521C057_9SPHI|nr:metal-dependent hydrolase [Solitalea koreensis]SMO52774.1 L-ascorbate metabolism protein UlaG, beta-lactamase superfamily [Solitalea koreensis]